MQIVIALPAAGEMDLLRTQVCGVPLLTRLVKTALRSGGTKVLLLVPDLPPPLLTEIRSFAATGPGRIETIDIGRPLNPEQTLPWWAIEHCLDNRFLWLPYHYICHKNALTGLLSTAARHQGAAVRFADAPEIAQDGMGTFDQPAVLLTSNLVDGIPQVFEIASTDGQPGISVRPPAQVKDAEIELVRRSGKVTDGIYSRFNRMLCRPAVRWLSHTRVTPNEVTVAGLAVAVASAPCFAQGSWAWNVAGAALFFVSGLFDEIDGMLARLKFRESAFGCWFETMVDYASYLLIFAGMSAGGYRNGGWIYLPVGASLLFGCLLSFVVVSVQRRLAAPPERPNEYSGLYLHALDRDAANPISRVVRQLQFLTKKGVLMNYLVVFALFGALPVLLFLAALGANVVWMVTIYFNRRLFSSNRRWRGGLIPSEVALVEVKK